MAASRVLTARCTSGRLRPRTRGAAALTAAAALALAPLAVSAPPAAAADSVSFLDENPDDGFHVFASGVILEVAQLSIEDELAVSVDGDPISEDDVDAWIDLSPEIGDDATEEEWDQAVEDFLAGQPMDVIVDLWIFVDVPDGAELTVTIGGASATNTMIASPEWSSTGPSRVYTDDIAEIGLTTSGVVSPVALPHIDGEVHSSVLLYEQDDFQEISRVWIPIDDTAVGLADDGSFDGSMDPSAEFWGIDFDWSDVDDYSTGSALSWDGADSEGVGITFARSGEGARNTGGAGAGASERTGDATVDAQLDALATWYVETVDDFDEFDDFDEVATLADIAERDALDHGFHLLYGDFAGGQWEFEEENGGAFAIRHGSAPGADPSPTTGPTDGPTTGPTDGPTDDPTTDPAPGGEPSNPAPSDTPAEAPRGGDDRDDRRAGDDRLPRTGSDVAMRVAVGGLLVATGAGALMVSRRRRS